MKLRKLITAAVTAVLSLSVSFASFAAEADLKLSLNKDGVFSQVGGAENESGKLSLGERLKGIAPGESRTTITELVNNCAYADFYINTETLDTFEGDGASKGYYDIQLSVEKNGVSTVIYDTTLGGYAENEAEGVYGLLEMNENMDSYVYLTTLDVEESAFVTFTITLDGETVGNSYFSTDAIVDFDYQAIYMAPETVVVPKDPTVNTVDRKVTKYVASEPEVVTVTVPADTVTIMDENVPLDGLPFGVSAAKTGDSFELYIYIGLLVLAVVVFALTFKKKKKDVSACLLIALLAGTVSLNVEAKGNDADYYMITYRAGNVGSFEFSDYASQTESYQVVDSNAYYVTYKVKAGAKYPEVPTVTFSKDSYEIDPAWMDAIVSGTVKKSEDLVVDYTKLTNPVEYTITYVDEAGKVLGEKAGKGNIGETVVFAKNIEGYRVVNGTNSFVLAGNKEDNQFSVVYVLDSLVSETIYDYTDGGTTTVYRDVEDVVYTPGGTVYVTTTAPGQTTVLAGNTNTAGQTISATQNNTQNAGLNTNTVAVTPDQVGDNAQQGQAGNNGNAENTENADNTTVEIEDEKVPLSSETESVAAEDETVITETTESASIETLEIADEETAKAGSIETAKRYMPIIIVVVVLIIAGCIAMILIQRKRKIS